MKKILLSIICSAAAALTFAQIPNNSFENWTTIGSYSNPNNWGTMNNSTTIAGVYTATKGTPGNPGTAYLKLTSKTVTGFGVVNGIAVSGQLDSTTMLPKSGFAFNQRPANFTGRWQHMIYGSTQGSILVTLTRWDTSLNQRVAVGSASTTLSGMAMSWANFGLPFSYTDGGYPDTCIIVLKASGAVPADNDYLWVDNLGFTGTVTAVQQHSPLIKDLNVYPNPSTEKIIVSVSLERAQKVTLELIDVTGKIVLVKDAGVISAAGKHEICVSEVKKGNYFLRVSCGSAAELKKIVIE